MSLPAMNGVNNAANLPTAGGGGAGGTMWVTVGGGGSGTTATSNVVRIYNATSTSTAGTNTVYLNASQGIITTNNHVHAGNLKIDGSQACKIELPDGTIIDVKDDGSYEIIDKDATIRYRANPLREFNRYINASDLLEEFIDFVDGIGQIDKQGFLDLPIELFIKWLVIRAAEADGEALHDDEAALRTQLALPPPTALSGAPAALPVAHCRCCGRFIPKKKSSNGLMFCNADHFEKFAEKVAA